MIDQVDKARFQNNKRAQRMSRFPKAKELEENNYLLKREYG